MKEDFKTVILSGESPSKVQKMSEIQAFKVFGMKNASDSVLSSTSLSVFFLYVYKCVLSVLLYF